MTDEESNELPKQSEIKSKELFPPEERRRIVRRFIEAYMSGAVKIRFLLLEAIRKQTPRKAHSNQQVIPRFGRHESRRAYPASKRRLSY